MNECTIREDKDTNKTPKPENTMLKGVDMSFAAVEAAMKARLAERKKRKKEGK